MNTKSIGSVFDHRFGPRLALSPWARDVLLQSSEAAIEDLYTRAARADAKVSALRTSAGWTVHAWRGRIRATLFHEQTLVVAIDRVLAAFELEAERQAIAEAQRFTPDELVTLQDQTA